MLLKKLYSINELTTLENNTLFAEVSVSEGHEIFKGHFPEKPVMPGVCLVNMITDIVSLSKKRSFYLKSADFVKFIQLVTPSVNTLLTVRLVVLSEIDDILRLDAVIYKGDVTFLKFKGCFEKMGV